MVLISAPPPVLLVQPFSPGKFVFQLQGQSGARYVLQSSADLSIWTNWLTNTLSGPTANFTNFISGSTAILARLVVAMSNRIQL